MEAAIRECYEELGMLASFDERKFRLLMEFNEQATSDPNLTIHMNLFVYEGELEGELTTSDEIESFMWFSIEDNVSLLSFALRNVIIPYCKKNKLIY